MNMIRRCRSGSTTEALSSSVAYTSSGARVPHARASSSIIRCRRGWSSGSRRTPCGSNGSRRGKIATRTETPRTRPVSVTQRLLPPPRIHGRIAAPSRAAAIARASV